MPRRAHLAPLLSVLLACGDTTGMTGFSSGPNMTTVAASSTSSASSGSSTTGSGGESGSTSTSTSNSSTSSTTGGDTGVGPKLDMPVPDGGGGQPIGCAGKIDFLVVVSADGSMKTDQELLIASFPDFIDTIKSQLPDFDVHIISAASHPLWAFDTCVDCDDPMCDPNGGFPFCGVQPEFCDKGKIGASVTFPVGEGASNRRCELYGGNRFIISDEPNMEEAFACIAQVGTSAAGLVAEAMVRAIGPEWVDGPNKCNKGFLRDDALLVVVLIKDTYDVENIDSAGTVDSWIAALREAKQHQGDGVLTHRPARLGGDELDGRGRARDRDRRLLRSPASYTPNSPASTSSRSRSAWSRSSIRSATARTWRPPSSPHSALARAHRASCRRRTRCRPDRSPRLSLRTAHS